MSEQSERSTVVVGGGLAGLTCAVLLARQGHQVTLLEGSRELGGRARTEERAGFSVNLGPHALYRTGAAREVLESLGVPIAGAIPRGSAWALGLRGPLKRLPLDPWSAVSTSLLSPADRWAFTRFAGSMAWTRPSTLRGRSVTSWLQPLPAPVRDVAHAVVRVATYCAAPDALDAGATAAQLQRAMRGVDYLHGGWQSLVDGLVEQASRAGVDVRTHSAARAVDGRVVRTDSGSLAPDSVVLCVSPGTAARLTASRALEEHASAVRPVLAACLDVALDTVTDPAMRFGLGLGQPTYVAVHSDVARLAPEGGTLLHATVYGAEGDEAELRAELEAQLDLLHPNWRQHAVFTRWMPRLTVCHDLRRADASGNGAPLEVVDRPGVFCAGDWVGSEGMLADAAVASASSVAHAIVVGSREAA